MNGAVLPTHNATTSSLNWSGYVTAPGSGITGVKSTFTVPTVNPVPPGFAANWTGIGGYNTCDLIQAGTSEDAVQGYYAWYEILPASETPISNCAGDAACTVNPGDVVPANTGTNYFGPTSTFTDAAGTHTIAQGNPVTIDMGFGLGVNEAMPSGLASNGQSFNVCAYQQSCPTPSS